MPKLLHVLASAALIISLWLVHLEAVCSGVSVAPTTNLQTVIDANPPGTTFCLQTGTFNLSVGAIPDDFDKFIGVAGTVLDGGGTTDYGMNGSGTEAGQTDVTIQNITFQNFDVAAVKTGWRWVVEDSIITGSLTGIIPNKDTTVRNNVIHGNQQYGLSGGGDNTLIVGNDIYNNNTSLDCGGACVGDAGASKLVGSTAGITGIIWRNNKVHDNNGMGIWSDGNVINALYENNTVENNTDVGIFHEISWGAVIQNNTLTNNSKVSIGQSCWFGSNIHVNNSTNVEIFHNVVNAYNGANGICAVSTTRSESPPYPMATANLNVHLNIVTMALTANSGLVVDSPAKDSVTTNNVFSNNRWRVPTLGGTHWVFMGAAPAAGNPATWAQWQAAGQDTTGVVTLASLRRIYR